MRFCPLCGGKMKETANLPVKVITKNNKILRRRNVHRFSCTECIHEESTNLTEEEERENDRELKELEKKNRKHYD